MQKRNARLSPAVLVGAGLTLLGTACADGVVTATVRGKTDGPAVLDLTGRIDDEMVDLCSDADGCLVTLGATRWFFREGNQVETMGSPRVGAVCHLSVTIVDGFRHWSISNDCGREFATWHQTPSGGAPYTPNLNFFAPYYGSQFGIDGADSLANGSRDRGAVLNYQNACLLTEAPPTGTSSGYLPDTAQGFFLVAAHPDWMGTYYPTRVWNASDPERSCVLTVRD